MDLPEADHKERAAIEYSERHQDEDLDHEEPSESLAIAARAQGRRQSAANVH
jgi:hypothetical protein